MITEVQRWFNDGGDDKFRYTYDLNKDSVVFDVGGYQGKWSSKINEIYGCKIYIFEPIKEYYDKLLTKFINNENIEVFNFGLSNCDGDSIINLLDDGSSVYVDGGKKENIKLKNIISFINEKEIKNIDLLKLNVEGEEYNIMESLIKENYLYKIKNFQIQFHNFIPNCEHLRKEIRNKLTETHNEIYCYEFVWESWGLKK
jgi:FkbM family methyltransferase